MPIYLIEIISALLIEINILIALGTPSGGGILGPQSRTNITIFDDGLHTIRPSLTKPINLNNSNSLTQIAGYHYIIIIQANNYNSTGKFMISDSVHRPLNNVIRESMGGEQFLSIIENDLSFSADKNQRNSVRKVASVTDNGDGTYIINSSLNLQGTYQQRTFLAFPGVNFATNCSFFFHILSFLMSVTAFMRIIFKFFTL